LATLLLINIYRTPVSGVFRPNAFWFRGLWRKPGQRFAVCGKNPAAQIVQVEQLNERAPVALLCGEAAWPLAARAAETRESHDRIFYQFG
jgi:hypothetical protein